MPASPADGDRYAHQVARLVDDLEAALLRLIAQLLAKDTKTESRVWQAERLAELQWLKQKAQRATAAEMPALEQAIRDAILQAYNHGTATAVNDLDATGREFRPGRLPAADTALRLAAQPLYQTQRAAAMIPEILGAAYTEAVAAGASDVLSGGTTRLQASQRVLNRLLADGIRGFTDKAGRRWSLDTYVEMSVRTTTGQAAVAGYTAQVAAVGIDLVVVSDSPRECPLCRPWEGKVLSLSGQVGAVILPAITGGEPVTVEVAGTLAEAKAAGFQHPNCTHRVNAYLPGATKLDPPKHDAEGYKVKQVQRALERAVRHNKRMEQLALTPEDRALAKKNVRIFQNRLTTHIDKHKLKRLPYRTQIGSVAKPLAH